VIVCLSHARASTVLNPKLFAFAVWDFDPDGTPRDPFSSGGEVRYAIIVNLPVPLQVETSLVFLMQLIHRQLTLTEIRERGEPVSAFNVRIPASDQAARTEILDELHYGWESAAESIRRKATDAGLSLRVRYEIDLLPDRETLVRRLPNLRRMYNELEIARETVDKIVSMIGGRELRISAPRAPAAVSRFLEERLATSSVRYYMNQTIRDSEVCGNGYFLTGDEPAEFTFRGLEPESVVVKGKDDFYLLTPSGLEPVRGHVLHIKGIEQIESPYGVSLFEPLIPTFLQSDIASRAQEFATAFLARGLKGEDRERAEETLEFAREMLSRVEETLGSLLWFPRDHLPSASADLYFQGQERLPGG
jgi:hypothetical protein